jgi:hypothetical protein
MFTFVAIKVLGYISLVFGSASMRETASCFLPESGKERDRGSSFQLGRRVRDLGL